MINNANGWGMPNSFAVKGSFTHSGSYSAAGYLQHCKPAPQPKVQDLWCLPIQNFRIDGGKTNLYSQKVTIDWPEFRPQSPIFSGPTVKQDTTNIIAKPAANYNFDDCYKFGSCAPGVINQLLPGFQLASQHQIPNHSYVNYSFGTFPVKW